MSTRNFRSGATRQVDKDIGSKLVEQINRSPQLIRDYIHELEMINGNEALMVRDLFEMRQNIEGLTQMLLHH